MVWLLPECAKAFVEGAVASVVAGSATHPLDLIKVRMQIHAQPITSLFLPPSPSPSPPPLASPFSPVSAAPGTFSVGAHVVRTEGVAGLFSGVSATIARQASYSTACIGLYELLKVRWRDPDGGELSLCWKVIAGLVAGGTGAVLGNPADVAKVRMQADGQLPVCARRNYTGFADAVARMLREEGQWALWRGAGPTIHRAMLVTAAQLATYDQVKEQLPLQDGLALHLSASLAAGLAASLASNPVDVIKTRIMNMKSSPPPYTGPLDCLCKTVTMEGPLALYKGFVPTVMRQGPFTVVMFLCLEQMRKFLKDF